MELILVLISWIIGSVICAFYAKERGRKPMKWFLISGLLLSPVLTILVLTILPKVESSNSKEVENGLDEHLPYIKSLVKQAITAKKSTQKGFSKIGGVPNLPVELSWPMWNDKPQSFLCQINLSEIPEEQLQHGLPNQGTLFFFNNQEQETWGFDPKDKGSWAVLFHPSDAGDHPLSEPPKTLKKEFIYKEKTISFQTIETYPSYEQDAINKLNFNDRQFDEYDDLRQSVFKNSPAHQMFGFVSPVQGDLMDLECQLASNGIYLGDGKGYSSPEGKKLEAGKNDWILLFQLDTDDDAEMMWGDSGMLYYWIRKQDIRDKNFDNCWMILQCY